MFFKVKLKPLTYEEQIFQVWFLQPVKQNRMATIITYQLITDRLMCVLYTSIENVTPQTFDNNNFKTHTICQPYNFTPKLL